jgi:putative ABC transport system permease protein
VRLFVKQGLLPIVIGGALGFLAALIGSRLLSRWLFGVDPLDGIAFGAAAGCITAVALLASWLPARRAARVDPMTALRTQ